jgi:2-oxoglutarate dehydrogenase E1 component
MLRRQAIRPYRRPLIVMSPKSLLRHKRSVSDVRDLTRYGFQTIIDEFDETVDRDAVVRVILCSGKVYYDLLEIREHLDIDNVVIVRIEQLHPFPVTELANLLQSYPNAEDVLWCQEEPQNQGAWYQISYQIRDCLKKSQKLLYKSRDAAPSPAVGNYRVHLAQQQQLITEALTITRKVVSISEPRSVKENVN